jgi:hypothetical protein
MNTMLLLDVERQADDLMLVEAVDDHLDHFYEVCPVCHERSHVRYSWAYATGGVVHLGRFCRECGAGRWEVQS